MVRRACLPAAVEDADPLEGQCTHGGLMGTTLGALLPVVGADPKEFIDGLSCPFDKGLAQ